MITTRAFKVWTAEGGVYGVRIDIHPDNPIWYGSETGWSMVIGTSPTFGEVRMKGVSCTPEVGANLAVRHVPGRGRQFAGETINDLDYETISRVEEIPVPDRVIEELNT